MTTDITREELSEAHKFVEKEETCEKNELELMEQNDFNILN